MAIRNMISFDWALKRLLRNKANFEVLEGFLSELLQRRIIIRNKGESQGNQSDKEDKYNQVDVFVEADEKELVIIELQFNDQHDYFQRMLYGASNSIMEHIQKGDPYSKVRKVYSINIVHFDLGEGEDYIYRGFTSYTGLRKNDQLKLNANQRQLYNKIYPGDLCPEYYILKVKNFDDVATTPLDEWIYYLKNNKIKDEFTAKGLDKARRLLAFDNLSDEEKREYRRQVEMDRIKISELEKALYKGEVKGRAEGEKERARLQAEKEAAKAEKEAAQAKLKLEKIDTIIKSYKA
ncbi:MAG: Rpn family recombination-promoting nuclease/putative transposase, partial [Bacteroidales bacterium]|nr:Rpn family recombination-promoting nuclease/putative transposase [Bacteroidales bacterium]